MADDSYKTIKALSEGYYTEKRSRFISYAIPVRTVEEVKAQVEKYRKQYYDARHVCWAYMLGPEHTVFRANDDGEPSSTAGKPILGQIRSNELTDILVVVIRYFGGIELGTSGLIVAYRTAAAEAIAAAEVEERTVNEEVTVAFEYPYLNGIMRIVKEEESGDCFPAVRDGLQNDTPHPQRSNGTTESTITEGGKALIWWNRYVLLELLERSESSYH